MGRFSSTAGALVMAALLAACSDEPNPHAPEDLSSPPSGLVSPPAPVSSTSGSGDYFTVTATVDGNANCTKSTSTSVTSDYDFAGDTMVVTTSTYNVTNCTMIDGGFIYVHGTANGVTHNLGTLEAESMAHDAYELPSGGYATMEASPNSGCEFLVWRAWPSGTFTTDPVLVHQSGSSDYDYIAEFKCSGGDSLL